MPVLVNKFVIPELGIEIDMDINAKVTNGGSSFNNFNYSAFYLNVVKQNLKEFYNDELNQRKAINACISLYHMADWYIPDDKAKRKTFYKKIPNNKILECVTNGTKHCNKNKEFKTGKKEGSYIPTKLIVDNGTTTYNLIDILKDIENFWDITLGLEK